MKFIKNQFSLWRIVLFVGVMAIAVPIGASLSPTATAVEERQEYLAPQTGVITDNTEAPKHSRNSKAEVGQGVMQGYYWDRRRQYWEDRMEDDLDEEDTGDDDADSKDSKAEDDAKDDDGFTDEEYDRMERRREYWRQSLEDEDW